MNFVETIKTVMGAAWDMDLSNVSPVIIIAMVIVCGLIVLVALFSSVVAIYLAIKYIQYNRQQNSLHLTGEKIARRNLDNHGLQQIKVSKFGSFLFGNSYSHYFKKVRLRRLTWQKTSVAAMAMAYQKSELAVLDKNGDQDMKTRIVLTPLIYFGSLAFIPLILLGLLLDVLIFNGQILPESNGAVTLVFAAVGLISYLIAFVLTLKVLKTEIKAQKSALAQMQADGVSADDIDACKSLFKLYNLEYVNDVIIALLEMIYRVLQLAAYAQGESNAQEA